MDLTYFHCYLLSLLKGIVSTLFSCLLPNIADFIVNLGQLGMFSTLTRPMTTSTSPISSHGKSWGQTSFPTARNYKTYPQMALWVIYFIYVYYLKISVNILCIKKLYITPFNDCPKLPGETLPLPVHEIYVFMSTVFKSNNGVWETQKLEHL